jgi:predicted metalloprotease with PDZ domain
VDIADLSSFYVEMRLHNVADTFRIAMMAHPEYDDRFWRYVKDLRVQTKNGNGKVLREDSALWRITAGDGEAIISYRVHLPPAQPGQQRAAWRPFLSPTGGLLGGPHSFMYVVGATLAPSHISLQLPEGWTIATGLTATSDPNTFFAASAAVLMDAPILAGHFQSWSFMVDQVPHRIVYWPAPGSVAVDSLLLVNAAKKIVQEANTLFGRLPYRDYTFLIQDDAYGALEHANSVTLGLPAEQLSKYTADYLNEIAHEYFHAWNLVRIHPAEWNDITYKDPPLARGLWWSEGLTLFYADLLLRKAGLPVSDSSRIMHLEGLLNQYYGNPGNSHISAEKVSLASNGPPGMLGDYNASTHLQGELIGNILDLIVRDATNERRSIDDVMRKMMEDFSGAKGFTSKDVEQAVTATCSCNVHAFFQDHIYGNQPIDINKYLQLAGMHADIKWTDALSPDGKPMADLRVYAYQLPGSSAVKLGIMNPQDSWGKAGLHTGDLLISVNNTAMQSANDFRRLQRAWKIGDILSIKIKRPAGVWETKVVVAGYKEPASRISEISSATGKQRGLRAAWSASK